MGLTSLYETEFGRSEGAILHKFCNTVESMYRRPSARNKFSALRKLARLLY